jgi:septal ring-binding cell division protein DamX
LCLFILPREAESATQRSVLLLPKRNKESVMKAIKSLVAATALLTTLAATAQTVSPASNARAARDEVFSEFVYDALGATPKIQLKATPKTEAKAAATEDKAVLAQKDAAAKQDAKERAEAGKRLAEMPRY